MTELGLGQRTVEQEAECVSRYQRWIRAFERARHNLLVSSSSDEGQVIWIDQLPQDGKTVGYNALLAEAVSRESRSTINGALTAW
jgi:hypothetical protein